MAGSRGSFDFPAESAVVDDKGFATLTWLQTFQRWHTVVTSLQQSGLTADRPTAILWIGRRFYDVTLNKPVWVSAVKPTVWRDAAGVVV